MATRKKKPAARRRAPTPATKKPTRRPSTTTKKPTKAPATRKKAATTPKRRVVDVSRTPVKVPTAKALPFVWKYETGVQAVGLWVDEFVWAANDAGEIFVLTKDGTLERSYKLPQPVHCLLADEAWKYAGCNDGKVYDLTGRSPRAMYEVGTDIGIDWISVYRGTLGVSDNEGGVTVVDVEGNKLWENRDKNAGEGWMLRADGSGLYHGSEAGVRKYSWQGKREWTVKTGDVRFGWMEGNDLVVTGGYQESGFKDTSLVVVTKAGKLRVKVPIKADRPDHKPTGAESCAAGGGRLFASTGGYLFCYATNGARLWQGPTKCGSACTMQLVDDLLYVVTSKGTIGCIDVSAAAIERALTSGAVPKARTERKAKVAAASTEIERVKAADVASGTGVVVECVKEGAKVRVRVVSDGYHADWFVQFPRDLREEGARFVVDEVREATQGGFYRVLGDIKRVE